MVVEVKSNVYRGENESDEMKWWRWGVDGGCDGRLVIKVKRAIIHYTVEPLKLYQLGSGHLFLALIHRLVFLRGSPTSLSIGHSFVSLNNNNNIEGKQAK